MMTWLQRYRIRHYVENSIWILPSLSIVVALLAVRLLHGFEEEMGWESTVNPETARSVLATMAASMFTFIVFVSSALLVSVQLASSQLTPRIIGIVFRDPVTRFSLTVFVFAFTFSLGALVRIKSSVPPVTAFVAALICSFESSIIGRVRCSRRARMIVTRTSPSTPVGVRGLFSFEVLALL
jgi:uncharacterized membrane protein